MSTGDEAYVERLESERGQLSRDLAAARARIAELEAALRVIRRVAEDRAPDDQRLTAGSALGWIMYRADRALLPERARAALGERDG